MRILVRAPNWIGDQILAYPFFHYLRKANPGARIGVACVPWVASLQFRDLVDEVVELEKPLRRELGDRLRTMERNAARLRAAGPWDLGICLPNSFSAAWVQFRAGARGRRGYRAEGRGLLLNEGLPWREERRDRETGARRPTSVRHRAEDYVRLLPDGARPSRPVTEFWGVPPENELDPGVPGELERFDAERSWPGFELVAPPREPYWVLAPGSAAESRRWPAEAFASLARQVAGETGWRGVIVGGVSEAPLAAKLVEDRGLRLLDRTAQGPVPALSRLFAGARFTVSNDSGLAHVAALCGSPTQVIWGAGEPRRTEPIGPGKVRVILNPVECWPCERNACDRPPGLKLQCLRGISPDTVWKEIKSGIRPT